MLDLISKGGPLMWLLLGCSILTIALSLERYFHFHRAAIDVGDLLHGLRNLIRNRNYAEALHECAGTPGPVARVIHSAIIRHDAPRTELKEIVQESGQLEVPKLEKYLAVLLSVAYVAPLSYGDTAVIELKIERIGNTSVVFGYRIRRKTDGALCFEAHITTVLIDLDTMKPVPIPEELRTIFDQHFDGGA